MQPLEEWRVGTTITADLLTADEVFISGFRRSLVLAGNNATGLLMQQQVRTTKYLQRKFLLLNQISKGVCVPDANCSQNCRRDFHKGNPAIPTFVGPSVATTCNLGRFPLGKHLKTHHK